MRHLDDIFPFETDPLRVVVFIIWGQIVKTRTHCDLSTRASIAQPLSDAMTNLCAVVIISILTEHMAALPHSRKGGTLGVEDYLYGPVPEWQM